MSSPPRTRRALAGALALPAAALLAGCGSSGGATAPSTTRVAVTTTVPKPVTTLAARAVRGFPTPDDATNEFMDDWQHDRKAAMSQIADRSAVVGVYQTPPGPFDSRGCEEPSNPAITTAGCVFQVAGGGLLQVSAEKRAIGWVVSDAMYQPLSSETS
ncbi:MAG TPA: hypothetical protein VID05_06645 [Acidimicrobiales bacterium]